MIAYGHILYPMLITHSSAMLLLIARENSLQNNITIFTHMSLDSIKCQKINNFFTQQNVDCKLPKNIASQF